MNDFPDWLNEQLRISGWKPTDLAKRAGIDDGVISRIISRERKPSSGTLKKIARALNLPEEEVFHAADILKGDPINDRAARLAYRIGQLPAEDQEIIDAMIDGLYSRRKIRGDKKTDLPENGSTSKP
jgi:transcriptional regulator with XRE-family HTH domain